MIAVNYFDIKNNFQKYCDVATHDCETIIVARREDENIVIMAETEYNNLMENLYVRNNSEDYRRLLESIDQLKQGKGQTRALMDDE